MDRRTGDRSTRLRLLRLKLADLLRPRAGGFFIPYRLARFVQEPTCYPEIEAEIAAAAPRFMQLLDEMEKLASILRSFAGPAPVPRFDQDWFPRLDAAAAYTLVRIRRPSRIVEIGSGHSTRFLARALQDNGSGELICIDPSPRADITKLPNLRHRRRIFAPEDLELLSGLVAGDMLFVDSSHVAMPGTDVDLVVSRGLRRLTSGVLVHFHDVFLPDGYPRAWAWRGYNEQLLIGALLAGGAYTCRFASHYVVTRMASRLAGSVIALLPMPTGAVESSLWLEKT